MLMLMLMLSAVLTGCGGGGGGSADTTTPVSPVISVPPVTPVTPGPTANTGQPGADYFPLAVGHRWSYTQGDITVSHRVTSTRTVDGRLVYVVAGDDPADTPENQYEKTATLVSAVSGPADGPQGAALGSLPVLRLPLVEGDHYTLFDRSLPAIQDFDGDGLADDLTVHAEVTVVGFERLDTPVGVFTNVAHVRTVLTQTVQLRGAALPVVVTSTSDDWLSPNIGPVRNVTVVSAASGSQRTEQTLLAYGVGALRSEGVPPTVLRHDPLSGATLNNLLLNVGFSEAMDRLGAPTGALVLTGPDGQPVPGKASWQDARTLSFLPAGVLASGAYTVRLADSVQDLAGNALAGERAWTFTVDRQGPMVVAVSPAPGASGVAPDSAVQVTLDEAPDPQSLTNFAVSLTLGDGRTIDASLTVTGRVLTLTPQRNLLRGATYTLKVAGLIDALGNRGDAVYQASFSTDSGPFALTQALPGLATVFAAAVADFNADGRSDLLAAGGAVGAGFADRLSLFTQLPDGTLSAPVPLPYQGCAPLELAAGDIDGDGRAGILMVTGCGVEVLRQTAPAVFSSVVLRSFSETRAYFPRLLRLAGSARPALLLGERATTLAPDALRLWLPNGVGVGVGVGGVAGGFTAGAALPIGVRAINDVVVADFNGDGLDDIAVMGLLSDDQTGIVVLYQRSDGSFSTALQTLPNLCLYAGHLAAGDVDGDGRVDLVAGGASCAGAGNIVVMLQAASGGLQAPSAALPTANGLGQIRVADIDGDGRADLVTTHDSAQSVGLYLQRPGGGFGAEVLYQGSATGASGTLIVADLTGDGRADILAAQSLLRQVAPTAGQAVPAALRPARPATGGLLSRLLRLPPTALPAALR